MGYCSRWLAAVALLASANSHADGALYDAKRLYERASNDLHEHGESRIDNYFDCLLQEICGINARCVYGGVDFDEPGCACLPGYSGNPRMRCTKSECDGNDDCLSNEICEEMRCINSPDACVGACGVNAGCEIRNHNVVCSCPRGYNGDPFEICYRDSVCEGKPCGTNAKCTSVYEPNGDERHVCACPPGYFGDELVACEKIECISNIDCPDDRTCMGHKCLDRCGLVGVCGIGAKCETLRHNPICSCPPGTTGDVFVECIYETVEAEPHAPTTDAADNLTTTETGDGSS